MAPIKPDVTETATLSDREFLLRLAQQTENLYTELSGRLDQQLRQLDHIDVQIHEVHQFIEEHKPSLARAVGLLDTGAKFQGFLTGKKGKK